MVGYAYVVVAGAVEPCPDSAEVAYARKHDGYKFIEKIPHVRAAKSHLYSVGLPFPKLKVGYAFAGLRYYGLLPGNLRNLLGDLTPENYLAAFSAFLNIIPLLDYSVLEVREAYLAKLSVNRNRQKEGY